ncbi:MULTISPECIES: DUF3592 domain-containing protein [Protofrankia]|uniref:DUF3592 domain-containing protein n=1 Tax=Protofrankia coriariae TaxID=1562887 RepID=A0ABR5EZZ7_9ACTN|nr:MULTISPECIES: DUF3592 domain-containing protein [Protofrankia]KLL10041.1 hypothetical protein FrCorBMG51_20545 [Protofrankia coriariae]ONH32519.1 hypothetical protein BL254_21735 [Protofrankia sp. BMG5.30]
MGLILKILGCLFTIGFGALLIFSAIAGTKASLERVWLRIRGHYTTGTVVDVDVDEDPDRYTRYTPTVDFVTRSGDRRVERLLYPVGIQHDVGARIRILYRPHDLSHVVTPDFFQGFRSIIFLPFLAMSGFVFIGVGVVLLIGVDRVELWNGWVLSTG